MGLGVIDGVGVNVEVFVGIAACVCAMAVSIALSEGAQAPNNTLTDRIARIILFIGAILIIEFRKLLRTLARFPKRIDQQRLADFRAKSICATLLSIHSPINSYVIIFINA